jgi:phage portal protein BeeE|tara:strand:+ start:519 stop:710 length:192 start_codon:yes stop_codon:yes gene_type:complete
LDFFEELPMTALLYRGHAYAAAVSAPKACVELTYRREHYNTCREEVARDVHPTLTYRGVSYTK